MKVLVQKFGGSSVAYLECMKKVRAKVLDAVAQGYKVVVVLSARAGQTNKLVEMAYQWSDEPNPAEYDALLATGEQESIALFSKISSDEMLEMASMGAKVLQIRSVEFAKKYKVPVWVRSTFTNDEGTLVTQEDESMMESVMVSGVAFDKDQVRITILGVPDQPGVSAALFAPLADHEILVDMIVQKASREGITDMTYTVSHKDLKRALVYTEKVAEEIGAQGIEYDDQVAKVSVIGVGMRNHSGVAAIAFSALHKANINILMISTSEIKISCLIHANELEKAVRTLHTTFGLDGE